MATKSLRIWMISAICLALCLFLPFFTGQIPEIGKALSPMHIPVLLCGFLAGWPYGMAVGFLAPLVRFVFFGMPPFFPIGIAMAFELAAYGFFAGLLHKKLPDKPASVYISLLLSMLAGRIVWGTAMWILSGLAGTQFTFALFLSEAFIKGVPGIICHIVIIPAVIFALRKTRVLQYG